MSENYFIENKETGKIELHFEKEKYMSLSNEEKTKIKSNFLFSRYSSAWVSRCKFPNLYRPREIALSLGLEDHGVAGERLSFEDQENRRIEKASYYDALIQQQGGIIDRKSLKKGMIVNVEKWGNVRYLRGGSKNITFEFLEKHMVYADGTPIQGQVSYAEIKEIVK